MALASVGTLGATASKTANQASTALTINQAAAATRLVVLLVAVDNNQTTDGDENAVTSVTDSAGGNTWSKGAEFTNGQGTAQTGCTISVWFSKLTNQINNSGTITVNFSNSASRDASALSAWLFTTDTGTTIVKDGTPATAPNDGADVGALDVTTSNRECLRIRAFAGENNGDATTRTDANWTLFSAANTSGGNAATNMTVNGEWRISTGTSFSSNPTATAVDHASVYVALAQNGSVGAATGAGDAQATGTSVAASPGSQEGTGAASATGASTAASLGESAGVGSADGVGASTGEAEGKTLQGLGEALATGESTAEALGAAEGVGEAEAEGLGFATEAPGVAEGFGEALAIGESIAEAVGGAAGTGAEGGVGSSIAEAVGEAGGAGDKEGVAPGAVSSLTWLSPTALAIDLWMTYR